MAARGKCPQCGREVATLPANPWRPFCSERCRLIDLGAWLSERHAIPGEEVTLEGADAVPPGEEKPT